MLCDDPEGYDGGEGALGETLKREGIYVYLELSHVVIQQKVTFTQHCKTIIFH